MALVSIITVNYNQPKATIDFLQSVAEYAKHEDIEVILVDNANKEDFKNEFINAYPGLIYLQSDKNLGYAGGNNLGIREAKGEYMLLLNNDTEITPHFIPTLVSEFEQNTDIGLLSPLIVFFDDKKTIQYAGFTKMNYITCRNGGIGSMEENKGQYNNDSRETGFCHGAAVMCRWADLEKAGLMDERYFLYYEELDWCEKFKHIDKKIWFTGKTFLYHKESMSVGRDSAIKTYFMTRNRMLFIRRNTGFLNTFAFTCYYFAIAVPKQVFQYIKKGRFDLVKQTFKAVWWNLTHSKNSCSLGFKIS
ncbi:MAG: glycosyltransferase family 2 protein [Niabella sp.]